jgi:tetratricopeptide (TPR) repeat protein
MKLKAVIFLLCYFTSSILLAQSIDSLNNIVSKKQLNEGTVKAHYLLAKIYTDKLDSAHAVDNYLAGITLSKNANLFLWAGYGYNELGYLFELMNENNTALNYYYQAIKNGKQHKLYTSVGRAYSNIGFVKKNQGKFDQAILNYDSSIVFYKLANHASEIANNMGNQAVLFQQLGNREKALIAFQKQLSIYDTLTNGERKKATPILNIGRIYLDQNNHDIAIKYFNESLLLSQKYKLLSAELLAQNNLGVAYFNKKEYTKAIDYIEKLF